MGEETVRERVDEHVRMQCASIFWALKCEGNGGWGKVEAGERGENRGLGCGKQEDMSGVEPNVWESSITAHSGAEFSRQYHLSRNHRGQYDEIKQICCKWVWQACICGKWLHEEHIHTSTNQQSNWGKLRCAGMAKEASETLNLYLFWRTKTPEKWP